MASRATTSILLFSTNRFPPRHHPTPTSRYASIKMSTSSLSPNPSPPSADNLEILGGGQHRYAPALFPILKKGYHNACPIISWNRHLETIFASFYRSLPTVDGSIGVKLRRECLRCGDGGGTVAIDWVCGDRDGLPYDSPVLILLPGLTGGSGDTYVQHMLVRARKNKWRVVVFNSRGCANSPVTSSQFYSASFTEDLRLVVKHVATLYQSSSLYAAGWSLGANILVRYLGEESHSCALSGAVSLCNPFNLVISDEDFRKGFNNVYDKALARSLRRIFKMHALLFEEIGGQYNIELAANAKTVKEFDEGLTRVSFGFESALDYYSKSSSSDSIKHVARPLLCIQAENDPIAPARGIPREDIKENPNCLLIVTPKGGHLGWVAGDDAPFGAPWTDPLVMEFLDHLERGKSNILQSVSTSDASKPPTKKLHELDV